MTDNIRKGSSEYPLKRIYNFKGLSVRPSIGYPLKRRCIAEMLAGQTISLASRTGRFRLGEKSTNLAQT